MSLSLLDGYRASPQRYDETFAAPGELRPHWRRFMQTLAAAAPAQLAERMALVEREVRENGVTYNVYADPRGADRPWQVDPIPLLVSPQDWAQIEAGIAQRARLLNALLADIYGPQALLREGRLPPALVYGHRGYLPPAQGIRPPGGIHLLLYAADLARSPDGRWWVFSDRTQAPSGAGYALENRLVVSRMFPELFRELDVEHQAPFFAALRASIARHAPRGDGPHLTVLLTPGPYNETYFEHALIARYLGFPLVEGSDLTVRDGRVWLKTVEGLKRVHAIVRRQDDDYCDPLELRADSALGVPGLTECARRGSVLLANSLGSGVLESGALYGYLPALCEQLLGEPLRLPSVATWWLGEPAALDDAWQRLDELIVKPVGTSASQDGPVFGRELSATRRAALREQVAQQPHRYVAQEWVRLSQAPALDRARPRQLMACAVGLRVFAVATGDGYAVMPGGLTRMAAAPDADVIAMQRGGGSKDTWVLPERPTASSLSLLRTTITSADLKAPRAHLSSRVAENLFWYGRYAERSECTARLLRVALSRCAAEAEEQDEGSQPVLALAQAWCLVDDPQGDPVPQLLAAATQPERGLGAVLQQMGRAAFCLRDRLSIDNWRTLNQLVHDPVLQRPASLPDAFRWLDRAVTTLVTLSGFALDGMTRGIDWHFMSMGRHIERLDFLALAIDNAIASGQGGLDWLLDLCDSTVTYRSRYLVPPEWLPVLDMLVRDDTHTRSIGFLLPKLLAMVQKIEQLHGPFASPLLEGPHAALRELAPEDLAPDHPALRQLLRDVRRAVHAASEAATHTFFTHAQPRSQLPA
ncbi:circularly permuted type 2 ATP-grasp protein [Caldimonas thermodepolymerans]|uniref:Circularly permuted ATP-grasp superfamily protein n=1 Tax=Caldimonas thermodepolymerans TaxID=215580 RepID=A0AA46DE84_9BURK|nr:circularly permuted type 2 ATP-grasp protein [Caldimonas thermodepolymerans]TCP06816.1 putative circularly permuted ATP-grasp superfamily protein [Caldimonas thermodepolymerans]UZG49136.1 circularly permuted type 2 ATP-grasp protein [Caldimonas thermodepolymerans]